MKKLGKNGQWDSLDGSRANRIVLPRISTRCRGSSCTAAERPALPQIALCRHGSAHAALKRAFTTKPPK